MEPKLFHIRQILLFIGECPFEEEVKQLLSELKFSSSIYINGNKAMKTKNLYMTFFSIESENEDVLFIIKESIYSECKRLGIGVLDFFLIDATNSPMFKSIWHDGFY